MAQALSLYQKLADEFAEAIRSGRLPAGVLLPSVRVCANQRNLSLNTVMAAYRLLEDRGLIEARPQSGFYVRTSLPEPQKSLRRTPSNALDSTQEDLITMILEAQQRPEHLDLALACPRGKKFYPTERLSRLTHSLLRKQLSPISSYALPPGSQQLREQIVLRGLRLGMTLSADHIILTHGATEALQLALRATTHAGDCIGIEAPAYFNLYPLLNSLGLQAIEIPTHPQEGLQVEAVAQLLAEKRISALVTMPTVHNPLGCTMPVGAKQCLTELARQYQVPVIEDVVYAELQYADPPEPAVKSFDTEGWIIVCGGFSKTLAPDYRLGWMDAGRWTKAIQQLKFTSSGAEPMLLCEAVGQFLESGHYEHHLRNLRRVYDAQVTAIRGLIARYFPAGTRATQPVGGFLLWVELPSTIDSLKLFHAALNERIVITPGRVYSKGSRYRHCIRLSCCQDMDETYIAAIQTLGRLAHEQWVEESKRS